MKRTWRCGAFFLLCYLAALAVNLPAAPLLRLLPPQIQATGAEGSFWSGSLRQLRWQALDLRNLTWRWGWHHGLPGVRLTAKGDAGHGAVILSWAGDWRLSAGRWQAPAQALTERVGSLLPFNRGGELLLELEQLRFSRDGCRQLAATLTWRDAALSADGQQVLLGAPQMSFTCQPQRLVFALRQQKATPAAAGQGSLDAAGYYRFSGRIGLPEGLPPHWRQLIEGATAAGGDGQRIIEVSGTWTLPRR